MPSMVMLPPRPNWPAEEISTELVLVGSKFGAGALPGTSSASSRKLRPLSGSFSMAAEVMTASTTDVDVSIGVDSTSASMTTVSLRLPTFSSAFSSTVWPTRRATLV